MVAFFFRTLHMKALDDLVYGHAVRLFREGCRLGIEQECNNLLASRDRSDAELAREQSCRSAPESCEHIGTQLEDPMQARRAFEYGCQVGRSHGACLAAARGYRSGAFVEPVPGRAERLFAWVEEHTRRP